MMVNTSPEHYAENGEHHAEIATKKHLPISVKVGWGFELHYMGAFAPVLKSAILGGLGNLFLDDTS
jgi:hypothetical protein